MFKKILVPLDRSGLAEQALPTAVSLATDNEATLILLHVPAPVFIKAPDTVKDMNYDYYYAGWNKGQEEGLEYLAGIKYGRLAPTLDVKTELAEGDVATALVTYAAQHEVDLIVMSTHGRSGLSRWLYGSVTEKVLSGAPCPVLAVRSAEPIKHVMIPLDGSALAETAVLPGLAIAKSFGATATLFEATAAHPKTVEPAIVAQLEQIESGMGEHLVEDPIEKASAYVSMIARTHADEGVDIKVAVGKGPAAEAILNLADDRDVDLIVMATHGRTGLSRWVYGSVTEKVLRLAERNLLVVRPL